MLNTPILFLVFNRPDTTKRVFESIRAVKPKRLFIAADGARAHKLEDKEKCDEVKKIVSQVDWECELCTLFRQENLGCGKAVSSAIDWFFSNVEQGIILEDDTLPTRSFFTFCEELLEKYKDDEHIGQINGSNFQLKIRRDKGSYYFSNYPMIWGWATWRRSWRLYEYKMESWPVMSSTSEFWRAFYSKKERLYWNQIFTKMHDGFFNEKPEFDTWDYQWQYTFWKYKLVAITPGVNLVTNIGFGDDATHTKWESRISYLASYDIKRMVHPDKFYIDKKADLNLFRNYFSPPPSIPNRMRNILYKLVPQTFLHFYRQLKQKLANAQSG